MIPKHLLILDIVRLGERINTVARVINVAASLPHF